MDCSSLGISVHHQLPELAQTHVCWVGDAIQLSHPLPSPSPPVFNLSQHQGLFQWVLCIRWPKYRSFSISLISFKDWLVGSPCSPRDSQESSTPQFKSFNSSLLSLLYSPALTSVHDYWKNHIFDYIWTFVSKVMSLLFNMLSRLVITFLPKSKHLLISCFCHHLQRFWSTRKWSLTLFPLFPSICHEVMGLDAMILLLLLLLICFSCVRLCATL